MRSGGDRNQLVVAMNHAADLIVRARRTRGAAGRRTGPRRGRACKTYRIRLPRGTREVTVKATVHGAREGRALRTPRARGRAIRHV